MKRCARCDGEKPLAEFARNRRSSDGHGSWCRACMNAYYRGEPAPRGPGRAKRRDGGRKVPWGERRYRVLALLAEGLTQAEVARRVGVSHTRVWQIARAARGGAGEPG